MHQIRNKPQQDLLCYPQCEKTKHLRERVTDARSAVVFLKLRREGCRKREAITFCSKPVCKSDTTKIKDGPSACRVLKPVQFKGFQLHGWELTGKREFDLGKQYRNLEQLSLLRDAEEGKVTDTIERKMNNNKDDYLYRIKVLNNFLQDLNQKCSLPRKDKALLCQKIEEMNRIHKEPIAQLQIGNVNLFEILREYPQTIEEQKEFYNNYINLFDSFDHFYNNQSVNQYMKFSKLDIPAIIGKKIPNNNNNTNFKTNKQPNSTTSSISKRLSQSQSPQFLQQLSLSQQNSQATSDVPLIQFSPIDKDSQYPQDHQPQKSFQSPSKRSSGLSNVSFANPDSMTSKHENENYFNNNFSSLSQQQQMQSSPMGRDMKISKFSYKEDDRKYEKQESLGSNLSNGSPRLKFIELKETKNKKMFFQDELEQTTDSYSHWGNIKVDNSQEDKFRKVSMIQSLPFNSKLDWLMQDAIKQRENRNSERNNDRLEQQLKSIQKWKDKLNKRTLQSFYSPIDASLCKTHSQFFSNQKKKLNATSFSDSSSSCFTKFMNTSPLFGQHS